MIKITCLSLRKWHAEARVPHWRWLICTGMSAGRWTSNFGVHCFADTSDCKGIIRAKQEIEGGEIIETEITLPNGAEIPHG